MRKLLGTICLLLIIVGVVGYYRGWFVISETQRDPQSEEVHIGVGINTGKIKSDEEKVKEAAQKGLKRLAPQPGEPPKTPPPAPASPAPVAPARTR
jgi:hypothetical protein